MSTKFFVLVVLIGLSCTAHGYPCNFSNKLSEEINTDGVELVKLRALAGELVVTGVTGRSSITVNGLACTDSEKYLEKITLDIARDGTTVTITVIIPDSIQSGWNTEYAYVDLDVSMPDSIPLAVRDSSGDLDLTAVSVISIDDSSGRIKVRNGKTDLVLNDSSGDILIRQLDGGITLSDSSGNIRLRDIKGDVLIERDGSGEIEISGAEKNVEIVRDGSGGIDIDQVGGSVIVGSDGSGSILVSNVTDSVRIGSDGSGQIQVADVGGSFSVDAKGSGRVRSKRVKGEVSVP